MKFYKTILSASLALAFTTAHAETIRIAIGTQDTTINCATGGLLIRELKLLEKYLPHDGKYKDAQYDIQWKNFTSGAPLTNEMVAGKLDIGSMADFPGSFNGAAFRKAGKKSMFINVLSGSTVGSGKGSVVGAAIGAVLGGLGGAAAEEATTRQKGVEITVKLDSGRMLAITQAADEEFRVGDRVRVLSGGGTTRVSH